MKRWMLGVCLSILSAVPAHAIGIDSMLGYTDAKGRVEFTITNSEAYRQYINALVSEVIIEKGQITKMPYTKDNVHKWSMEPYPARAILEPGFKKTFSLVYQPTAGEHIVNRDRVYQVSFVPTPYFAQGEEKSNTVKMAFGFAPLVIVPAKSPQPLSYDLSYRRDKVTVINKGNSYFTLYLDGCPKGTTDKARKLCSVDATVLAGRELEVPLPALMVDQPTLKAKMVSHGNKFKAEATLRKQA